MKHSYEKEISWIGRDLAVLVDRSLSHGIDISSLQVQKLELLAEKILIWNNRINLMSAGDRENFIRRHFMESVLILKHIKIEQNHFFLDIGSGAGFPGIIIKILRPNVRAVLIDSNRKRSLFLRDVVETMNFIDVDIICDRVESPSFVSNYKKQFDFIFARGVAKLKLLWRWSASLLALNGKLVAVKGGNLSDETTSLKEEYQNLKINIEQLEADLGTEKKLVILEFGE